MVSQKYLPRAEGLPRKYSAKVACTGTSTQVGKECSLKSTLTRVMVQPPYAEILKSLFCRSAESATPPTRIGPPPLRGQSEIPKI